MYFHSGKNETVLFDFWITGNSNGAFVGSLIIIFLMAFFYEGLKYFREHLYQQHLQNATKSSQIGLLGGIKYDKVIIPSLQFSYCYDLKKITFECKNYRSEMMSTFHGLQTILHMVQFVLSYFLMLIFMTYNVWLAIAVTLGAGLGFFVFGWVKRRSEDITEHCN